MFLQKKERGKKEKSLGQRGYRFCVYHFTIYRLDKDVVQQATCDTKGAVKSCNFLCSTGLVPLSPLVPAPLYAVCTYVCIYLSMYPKRLPRLTQFVVF
jgi:hypothetical protein